MTLDDAQRTELDRLLGALCDESITQTELDRLEEILAESEEAQDVYLETISIHGNLYWGNAAAVGEPQSEPPPPTASRQEWSFPGDGLRQAFGYVATLARLPVLGGVLFVTGLLAGWALASMPVQRPDLPTVQTVPVVAVGRLTRTVECRWTADASLAVSVASSCSPPTPDTSSTCSLTPPPDPRPHRHSSIAPAKTVLKSFSLAISTYSTRFARAAERTRHASLRSSISAPAAAAFPTK